jgi:hypothetical protein
VRQYQGRRGLRHDDGVFALESLRRQKEQAVKTVDRYVSIVAATLIGGSLAIMLGNIVPNAPDVPAAGLAGLVLGFSAGLLINALR